MKLRAIILGNEHEDNHHNWVKACDRYNERVDYRVVNLTSDIWLDEIVKEPCDILLAKPGGLTSRFKQLYDERIFVLTDTLGFKVFPTALEIFLYENKRFLASWLKANRISHPKTFVSYHIEEALSFIKRAAYPLVAKTNIGASGSGVKIIRSVSEGEKYLKAVFSGKGAPQRTGPNREMGALFNRGLRYLLHPSDIVRKLDVYQTRAANLQKGFVIFQEYVVHEYEWRVVRIGESFFAHKKLKQGDKASGTLLKIYDNPPLRLFDFVKGVTDEYQFHSLAVDIFESERGYLVNEMQCIFGQSDPYQMQVNGIAGRYRNLKDNWIFEPGDFARNACYDLRLDYILGTMLK